MQPDPTPVQLAERIIAPIVDPLYTTAIVLIVAVFVLLQREDLRDRLIRLFGSSDLHRTTAAMNDAARRLSRYFLPSSGERRVRPDHRRGALVIGVPSPLLWGIVGMLLRFVPYIGAPMAAVLPLALAAAVSPGWSMVIWTAALYLARGDHRPGGRAPAVWPQHRPVAVFGRCLRHLLDLAVGADRPDPVHAADACASSCWAAMSSGWSSSMCILGDRPALTPVESFYQRMLAGDPDEARDQAEHLLRDRPLSSYYDEVALKGLRLAAIDAARGVLTELQLERIKELDAEPDRRSGRARRPRAGARKAATDDATAPSAREQDVPNHPPPDKVARETLPAAWRGQAPVLCIAGRGPLDEAAASMLAQLLHKNGLKARVLPHDAVSRGVSARSMPRAWRWCACATWRSAARRRTCAICCAACASASRRRGCWSGCGRRTRRS